MYWLREVSAPVRAVLNELAGDERHGCAWARGRVVAGALGLVAEPLAVSAHVDVAALRGGVDGDVGLVLHVPQVRARGLCHQDPVAGVVRRAKEELVRDSDVVSDHLGVVLVTTSAEDDPLVRLDVDGRASGWVGHDAGNLASRRVLNQTHGRGAVHDVDVPLGQLPLKEEPVASVRLRRLDAPGAAVGRRDRRGSHELRIERLGEDRILHRRAEALEPRLVVGGVQYQCLDEGIVGRESLAVSHLLEVHLLIVEHRGRLNHVAILVGPRDPYALAAHPAVASCEILRGLLEHEHVGSKVAGGDCGRQAGEAHAHDHDVGRVVIGGRHGGCESVG